VLPVTTRDRGSPRRDASARATSRRGEDPSPPREGEQGRQGSALPREGKQGTREQGPAAFHAARDGFEPYRISIEATRKVASVSIAPVADRNRSSPTRTRASYTPLGRRPRDAQRVLLPRRVPVHVIIALKDARRLARRHAVRSSEAASGARRARVSRSPIVEVGDQGWYSRQAGYPRRAGGKSGSDPGVPSGREGRCAQGVEERRGKVPTRGPVPIDSGRDSIAHDTSRCAPSRHEGRDDGLAQGARRDRGLQRGKAAEAKRSTARSCSADDEAGIEGSRR
jgi:hypothetical protein